MITKRYFEKFLEKETIGKPMTPSQWVGEPKYEPITRILLSCGGGMGGHRHYEYVKRIPLDEIKANEMLEITTIDGNKKLINTAFVVEVDSTVILISAQLYSENHNFPTGLYTYQWIARDGHKVTLSDSRSGEDVYK